MAILRTPQSVVSSIALLVVAVGVAPAATIYGDFSDAPSGSVAYLDVAESSGTDPGSAGLYGPPTVTVNDIDFDPMAFVATSSGGPLDVTDGQLNFTVTAAPGEAIDSLMVAEGGDFSFEGFGGADTTASAKLSVRIEILDVDGVPLLTPIEVFETAAFAADMGTAGGSTPLLAWSVAVMADLTAYLPSPHNIGVTKAEIAIDNHLTTNSESDSLAFIAKKDFSVTPGLTSMPEPASAVMVLLGAAMLAGRRR